MPYIAIAPASLALLIALHHLSKPLLHRWRPKWTWAFISEDEHQELPGEGPKYRSLYWTIALLGISAIGFAAELSSCLYKRTNTFDVICLASWVSGVSFFFQMITLIQAQATITGMIAVKRPRSCSIPLLAYFLLAFAVEVSWILQITSSPGLRAIAHYVAACAALVNGSIILLMPFRTSSAPIFEISAVGQTPSSEFCSPEDNLRLWQFLSVSWMEPLISIGRNRQLHENDVWRLGFEFQHGRLHEKFRRLKGSVLMRTLRANGLDVLIISIIAIVQMLCDFSTPVLLQQLLKSMQDPTKPKRVPLTYAMLSLLLRLVAAQSQVLNLWYGRRCYERSRGEMVMMVYEKALLRKNILGRQEKAGQNVLDEESNDGNGNVAANGPETTSDETGFWRRLIKGNSKSKKDKTKEAASLGKIFNLLRGDVYDVAQRYWEVDSLIDKPLGLVIAVILVWKLFGPSCLLGILSVFAAQAGNAVVTKVLLRYERVKRAATDVRLQLTSQFVEAIRHLRWYGWQDHWLRQVMDARQNELNLRIITGLWGILISFINTFASGIFPVLALYSYTVLAGHELRIDIIFPALQLFSMLEVRLREIPSLITTLINASIALGRIEDFMAEPDKENSLTDNLDEQIPFHLESCTYAWPGKVTPVLKEISMTIPKGLTVISGKVGAGKTALLQSLLGELDQLEGSSRIPNEMVGYCAQAPWLQSMSIRDNILFSSPYKEQRYRKTLEACALLPDLSQFKHGDLTFIGENGIGLSGGQKARVALARAVYSASRVLLLDDPLSALDHSTAEFVTRKCLAGPLLQGRTVVLVTHRVALVRDIAAQIIDISDGRATVFDKSAITSSASVTATGKSVLEESSYGTGEGTDRDQEASAIPDKFIEEEYRAEWGVKARVYWTYIKAGKYRWWLSLVIILAIYRLTAVSQSWFLKEWGEAYNMIPLNLHEFLAWGRLPKGSNSITTTSYVDTHFISWNPFARLPRPSDDVRPWLWAFFCIVTFQAVTLLVSQALMLVIVYCAGRTLFRQVITRVSHATFRFFDVTPVGRLMNRLTSDIGVVDGNISSQFQAIAFHVITWISSILVIASATPTFLAFSLILTVVFVLVFLRFLPTSQSLRRLEMVSLTPLLSNFGELLHGLTTVRAFRAEERFQDRVISVVDQFQGMDHFYWSLQAWLTYRFESLSALSTFCLTVLALYTNTSPGLMAFVLIAANSFVQSTHGLCKQYGQLQMDFVSVERVDELLHVEEETPGTIEPPAAWPTYGSDVVFENATIRYAPHLDPSLIDVTLCIPGGSTTAIIGRTGSGKSTLAVSLLSAIRPESGRILIDNIDIAHANTQVLRTRVTFVAQDPVLFSGSIRLNLDPTSEFSDQQCAEVLERLCGRHGWKLETHIEAGGKNLSQGQRQLIALTRAVLRRSAVVILDEATASIDHETSLEIQQIVREELELSTVITIAHRVEAVKDAEYFIELDQGRVLREGRVGDL